jgi:DNA gyrase/topoisomerase IV subunit A
MCITSQGKSIKLKVSGIRVMGRSAQGVRILTIDKPDFVIGLDKIVQEDEASDKALTAADTAPADEDGMTGNPPEDSGADVSDDTVSGDPTGETRPAGEQGELF